MSGKIGEVTSLFLTDDSFPPRGLCFYLRLNRLSDIKIGAALFAHTGGGLIERIAVRAFSGHGDPPWIK
jgi:hypothetical protein